MSTNNRIALQFPDLHSLWKFAQTLTSRSIEITPQTMALICDCTVDEIHVAIKKYSEKILKGSVAKVTN
jgi:hypothetical protein